MKRDANDSLEILDGHERPQNGPHADGFSFASLNQLQHFSENIFQRRRQIQVDKPSTSECLSGRKLTPGGLPSFSKLGKSMSIFLSKQQCIFSAMSSRHHYWQHQRISMSGRTGSSSLRGKNTHLHLRSAAPQQVDKGRVKGHDGVPHMDKVILAILDSISVLGNN